MCLTSAVSEQERKFVPSPSTSGSGSRHPVSSSPATVQNNSSTPPATPKSRSRDTEGRGPAGVQHGAALDPRSPSEVAFARRAARSPPWRTNAVAGTGSAEQAVVTAAGQRESRVMTKKEEDDWFDANL
jgi:hypothetical protein